eukprot:m.225452 g.225452  ORF g.225452 m.225452 type:complete len:125 (-) comp54210_c0_seq16:311-685(-)
MRVTQKNEPQNSRDLLGVLCPRILGIMWLLFGGRQRPGHRTRRNRTSRGHSAKYEQAKLNEHAAVLIGLDLVQALEEVFNFRNLRALGFECVGNGLRNASLSSCQARRQSQPATIATTATTANP